MISNLLNKIPFIRRYRELSDGGLDILIKSMRAEGDYDNSFKYALIWMEGNCSGSSKYSHKRWWEIMGQAIKSGSKTKESNEAYEKLFNLIQNECGVANDRQASECLIKLSLWGYNFNNIDSCIQLADKASNAAPTWAEPYFVLGWLSLPFDETASLENFKKTIDLDQSYWQRISKDTECNKFPNLINKLQGYVENINQ